MTVFERNGHSVLTAGEWVFVRVVYETMAGDRAAVQAGPMSKLEAKRLVSQYVVKTSPSNISKSCPRINWGSWDVLASIGGAIGAYQCSEDGKPTGDAALDPAWWNARVVTFPSQMPNPIVYVGEEREAA